MFISEKTIEDSYNSLTMNTYSDPNALFYLLILKFAGISDVNYIDLNESSVKEDLIEGTRKLSYLFISDEFITEKYNFINPFNMTAWEKTGTSNPTQNLRTWAAGRLKNNIVGGSSQWRDNLIDTDPNNSEVVKLKQNYLRNYKFEPKVPINALANWVYKFNSFDTELTEAELVQAFKTEFSITKEENLNVFTEVSLDLNYAEVGISSSKLRALIGNPSGDSDWLERTANQEKDVDYSSEIIQFEHIEQSNNAGISSTKMKELLNSINQVILTGPPGTSKSFLANQIAESKDYDNITRIQFHPQYTYQDFIGGKILKDGTIIDQKGLLINLIEEAEKNENTDENYLLIIEEINRANVSQVFGELIQLLDRGESIELSFDNVTTKYRLPKNIKIIATMNSTDRTLGNIDYAIRRRFYHVYCGVDYVSLQNLVKIKDNTFSISRFLEKINDRLINTLNNKEMVLGHALFMRDFVFDKNTRKFVWSVTDFKDLFYYSLLPIIEDYSANNLEVIQSIIGTSLMNHSNDEEFITKIKDYIDESN